jgi:hypothetical protein
MAMIHLVRLFALLCLTLLAGCGGGNGEPSSPPRQPIEAATLTQVRSQASHSLLVYQEVVQQIYIAYFGRPADVDGLAYYEAKFMAAGAPVTLAELGRAYDTNPAIRTLVDSFSTSAESAALYPGDNNSFVLAIYQNLFNRVADDAGKAYWTALIDRGMVTRANAAITIMASSQSTDSTIIKNKVIVARDFTASLDTDPKSRAYSGLAVNGVVRTALRTVAETTDITAFQVTINAIITGLTATSPPPRPVVNTISPASVTLNQYTIFSLGGSNLVSGMGITLDGCTGVTELPGGTSTLRQFACTPTTSGTLRWVISDKPNGMYLSTFTIVVPVIVPPPIVVTGGQCYVNGYYRKSGTYVHGYWRHC